MPAAGHCTYLDGGRSRDYGDKPSKCSLNPHLQRTKTLLEREKGKCVQLHLLSAIISHYYQFMSPDLLLNLPKLSLDKPTGRKTAWFYKKCTVVTDPCEIRVESFGPTSYRKAEYIAIEILTLFLAL